MTGVDARLAGPFVVVAASLALASLDFVGSLLAKEWAEGRNHWFFAGGLVAFGVLFSVYAIILRVAELSTVTLGWIVCLQVGLLVIERVRYGVTLPAGKWVAIMAILVLQTYLIVAPNGETSGDAASLPRTAMPPVGSTLR